MHLDTGAMHCVIPPAVADHLGLLRLRRTSARYVNDQVEEVDMSEVVTIEMMGRQTSEETMIVGMHILIGVTVLEKLDLVVDCHRQRLIPNEGTRDQPVFRVYLSDMTFRGLVSCRMGTYERYQVLIDY